MTLVLPGVGALAGRLYLDKPDEGIVVGHGEVGSSLKVRQGCLANDRELAGVQAANASHISEKQLDWVTQLVLGLTDDGRRQLVLGALTERSEGFTQACVLLIH